MNNSNFQNDPVLLGRLTGGDEEAFAQLYRLHREAVLTFALRLLKSKPLAEEVCNDVFTAVWKNRQRINQVQCLKAYLLSAARNRAISALKSQAKQQAIVQELQRTGNQKTLDAAASVLHKEYVDFLRQQVAALPPRAKEVFGLCREEGCSYDEVSSRLGISRNAVKGHMVYSMKKLKSLAEKDFGISLSLLLFLLCYF